jgi:hypothetical protein
VAIFVVGVVGGCGGAIVAGAGGALGVEGG